MLTRRNMLLGTAGASIAAIACGQGVTAASDATSLGFGNLAGADAQFGKIHTTGADFFVKGENGVNIVSSFTPTSEGVQFSVQEEYTD